MALFDDAAHQLREQAAELTPANLARLAWSFATVALHAPALLDALTAEASRRSGALSAQQLANVLWACAIADRRHDLASAAG